MQGVHLSADALACRKGDRLLFAGISFAMSGGEALQLVGPNGIGKSSLIRILAGLSRPFAGSVAREGAVGLLDERPALDEHQPLARAIGFWSCIDGARWGDHAARLGIAPLADVPVRYLSTGQRKRAALCRLLGQATPIWLLDEPLNGLDGDAVALTEALVAEHLASGGIALIASHQPFRLEGLRKIALADFVPVEEDSE